MDPKVFNSIPVTFSTLIKCDLGGDTVVKFKSHLDSNIKAPTPILIPGLTAYRMGDSNSLMNWSSSLHFNNNIA